MPVNTHGKLHLRNVRGILKVDVFSMKGFPFFMKRKIEREKEINGQKKKKKKEHKRDRKKEKEQEKTVTARMG